ncbi:MAG: amidase, partial [Ferruginibacter sp.]
MNRRKFLHNSSLTSLVLTTAGISSFTEATKSGGNKQSLLNDDFKLSETTIDELQQKMNKGQLSSESITKMYLKRIVDIDKKGPGLNAVIEINPDAIQVARSLDMERKAGKLRGPLHGIPILVKDNINTAGKMMTTAGALALIGNYASKDAYIIELLKDAGAILLGKTNLSEWANFRSSRSTSGWSSRGGQTKSPYVLDRNPSGSSAGSGAATSANLCTIAIGTETNGSIVSPASINGLVGIKPTVGLWSRSGIIPISATQDTAGPMARTVRDAAILLGALTGVDQSDAITNESRDKSFKDYTKFLDSNGLKGKKIGIEKSHLKGHEGVVALFQQAIDLIKNQGATIVELDIIKSLADIGIAEFTVLLYEFKDGVNRYLSSANSKMKSLEEVIAFNRQNESTAMPYFKQETLIASNEKGDLNNKEYKDALAKVLSSRVIIADLIKQNNLDALCGVTSGLAGCIDLVNGDYRTGNSMSGPAAMAGYPHITLPMGFIHELPVGISFFNTAYTEPQLLSIAYA